MPNQPSIEFVSVLAPYHQEIVDDVEQGVSTANLAKRLNVTKATVARYVSHHQISSHAVLSESEVATAARDAEITRLRATGMSMKDISRRLDLGYETVRVFCRRTGIL